MALIDQARRARLLQLARAALEARVWRQPSPLVPEDLNTPVPGVFVSIHCRHELRGCLGTLDEELLGNAVCRLAGDVSCQDVRFRPVGIDELALVDIDLSVLTPPRPLTTIDEIEVGRHGLIVLQGRRRGLLLPQVAVEYGWDRERFLTHTCMKAGLPADAWRHPDLVIMMFEAEVFGATVSTAIDR